MHFPLLPTVFRTVCTEELRGDILLFRPFARSCTSSSNDRRLPPPSFLTGGLQRRTIRSSEHDLARDFWSRGKRRVSSVSAAASSGARSAEWLLCEDPLLRHAERLVLFGDLHVREASLSTSLHALEFVREVCEGTARSLELASSNARPWTETPFSGGLLQQSPPRTSAPLQRAHPQAQASAKAEKTVAVFLGDFWHSRVERNLHWGVLRPVLEFWREWKVPVRTPEQCAACWKALRGL